MEARLSEERLAAEAYAEGNNYYQLISYRLIWVLGVCSGTKNQEKINNRKENNIYTDK